MKRQYIYGLLLLLVMGTGSCKREHFCNEDNYIESLSFIMGEHIFNGEIKGNEILMNLPENVDLKEIKVKYELSERAAIEPLPQDVKEWKESNKFTVYSQNEQTREYTVLIKRIPVSAKMNVVLNSDDELEAFAHKGINLIDGDLIIGMSSGKEKVTSLKGLESLKEINYRLIIGKGYTGTDLKGLDNLQKAGSILIDKGAADDEPLSVNLPALTRCYNDITLRRERISTIDFEKLETLKDLKIYSCVEKSMNFKSLKYAHSILLENQGDDEEYAEVIDFPQLTKTDEPLRISNINQVKKLSLGALTEIPGININGMHGLKTIYAPKLAQVNELYFAYIKGLQKIDMPQLSEATKIKLQETEELENLGEFLAQFRRLENFDSYELIVKKPVRIDLSKCENLKRAEFYGPYIREITMPEESELFVYASERQTEIPVFHTNKFKTLRIQGYNNADNIVLKGVKEVTDALFIDGTSAQNIELTDLEKVGKISIADASKMQKFEANRLTEMKDFIIYGKHLKSCVMKQLTTAGNMKFIASDNLEEISCPSLTSITKELFIGGDYSGNGIRTINNLEGFKMLKSAKKVTIKYCSSLSDFSGLKRLFESDGVTKEGWQTEGNLYNPSFEDMKNGKYTKE